MKQALSTEGHPTCRREEGFSYQVLVSAPWYSGEVFETCLCSSLCGWRHGGGRVLRSPRGPGSSWEVCLQVELERLGFKSGCHVGANGFVCSFQHHCVLLTRLSKMDETKCNLYLYISAFGQRWRCEKDIILRENKYVEFIMFVLWCFTRVSVMFLTSGSGSPCSCETLRKDYEEVGIESQSWQPKQERIQEPTPQKHRKQRRSWQAR